MFALFILINPLRISLSLLMYFSLMQRKAILALLLLSAASAGAQQKDTRTYRKETTVEPRVNLGAGTHGVSLSKGKKAIPEPLPPTNQLEADYKSVGSPMPPLRVVAPSGQVFTDSSLKNEANLFVMMFNPTCEHCEDMTRALEKDIALFKSSALVLMATPNMGPYLEYFDKNTKYSQYPTIKVGLDSSKFIDHTFTYQSLPQINVYDKDRKLIKSFSGINTIDSLKPYIQ
jgi:thiol-disulfide isomerase/thioredoxin